MTTALVFVDGFDKYGPPGNVDIANSLLGEWSGTAFAVVDPLSSAGYAVAAAGGFSTASLPSSLTRIAGSVRYNPSLTSTNAGFIIFRTGATSVFALNINTSSNVVEIRTGSQSGTVVASGGTAVVGVAHVLSWDVTIGASGAYNVYLDGVSIFSGTGNTGNGQSSVNLIGLGGNGAGSIFDDLCVFDPAHAAYNSAVLTQNVVVETQFPSGDNQTQFVNDGNVVPAAGIAVRGVYRATAGIGSLAAGRVSLLKITPVVACTLNSVSLVPTVTSAGAKNKGVVYADSAGAPGALLSSGTEVVGVTNGATLTLPLVTPQSLSAGTSYWIGLINDTTLSPRQYDNGVTLLGIGKANTYGSGAPSPAGGSFTTGIGTWMMWGNCTGAATNWASESLNPPLGTVASQVHSSNVGDEDLYTFPALSVTPTAIYGMAVKGFVSKSDAGTRTISFNTKSVASDSTGSNAGQSLSTTKQWQNSIYDADPATGVAWVAAGLNSAKSGQSVAS